MKHFLAIFLIGFISIEAFGQQSVDVGFFGGAGTYFGDMTKVNFSKSINPAIGGFFRYNFNPRYALRFNVMNSTIGADGEFDSNPWSFNKNVLDVSVHFEFNYMKYIVGDKETPWSTFLFGGIGMQSFKYNIRNFQQDGSEVTPTLPFGLGVKFDLSKRLGVGIEGGFRKSLSDKLDDLDDPYSYTNADGVVMKYTDTFHNNDWTAYMGIHLVYKLIYGTRNWEVRTPRKNILDWGIWNKDRKQ